MKPIMRQQAMIAFPIFDVKTNKPKVDQFDRPITGLVTTKARVQRKVTLHRDASGTSVQTTLEVDLPPDIVPLQGYTGQFEVPGEGWVKGTIRFREDIYNLSGSRVDFRTVFADG